MGSALFTAGIIIGITLLFVFIFSTLHKRGKQKSLALQKAKLEAIVSANNLVIKHQEQFDHYLVALDTDNAKLLYLDFSSGEETSKVIDLHKTKSARVDMTEDSIYEEVKGKSVLVERRIAKLQIELDVKDAGSAKEQLVFFQAHKDGTDDFVALKKRVSNWNDKVNDHIRKVANNASA